MEYKELKPGWCYLEIPMPIGKSALFNRHDPVTIALVVGGTLTAVGQVQEGRAAKAQGRAEKKIAEFNAVQKEREARSRMEAAQLEEERVSKKEKIFKAEQRVRFKGITLEGSPVDLLAETAGEFAKERALTIREGLVQSGQLKTQASILRAGGKLSAQLGKMQQTASFIKAGGTVLSTFATASALSKPPLTPNINPRFPGTAFRPGVSGPVIPR